MKRKIFLSVTAIILIIAAFITYKIFGPAVSVKGDSPQYLFVKTGSSFDDLKKELLDKEFISSTTWFSRASQILKFETVKPGRYKLSNGMSVFNLARMLRNGQQTPVNFVITKFRTKEDLARRAGKLFECDSTQLISYLNNNDSIKQFDVDSNTVMSLALPLTYSINWNTTPKKILQHFHKAWKEFWTDERKQKATSLGLTMHQVFTLASIIDEETNNEIDRPKIASVYINRLAKNMPLQADPTVKFGLKDFGLKRILYGHTQTPSPYNTYLNTGLPPGPICTPQAETIDAVLNAPKTDYLYFVANSTFDGTHVFTSDYDDHMKYARLYQAALTKLLDSANKK
ncbi:MAG: endolytic transglycosylase MltG [Bacteroidetes bacterium]|nr:MAG: endolytic transglycosylase MltG [Bacteroidota bacterium]